MNRALQNPIFLLITTGTLLGLYFPLGKLAGQAHISPLVWAFLISFGSVMVLLPVLIWRGDLNLPRGKMVRYVIISGLISYTIPNALLLSTIPHTGAGFAGLMFALSPVFTLAFSTLFRLKTVGRLGLIGLFIGLVGAIIVSISRSTDTAAPSLIWIAAAMTVPLFLAIGNVYRTLDWPEGGTADTLAFWSHVVAIVLFLFLIIVSDTTPNVLLVFDVPTLTLSQIIVAGLTFPIFFRLQSIGGPVLLSQIGYVSAAVSLLAATLFLGESYSLTTWLGAGVISIGIFFTISGQMKN